MNKAFTKEWWAAAGIRAIRTIAQTAIATIGTAVVMSDVNWLAVLSASVLYIFRLFVVLLTLLSMVSPFTVFKDRLFIQIILLNASALSIILDYYMNISMPGSDNLLWFLPMIIVIYITRYRTLSNSVNKSTDK